MNLRQIYKHETGLEINSEDEKQWYIEWLEYRQIDPDVLAREIVTAISPLIQDTKHNYLSGGQVLTTTLDTIHTHLKAKR